jgi:outer membrane protein OmpA-like peptidoglycan-associated protein
MRFLIFVFLFVQLNAFAQLVVDVQKEYCHTDADKVNLIYKNHTDSASSLTAYEYYNDVWTILWLNHLLEQDEQISVPPSTYFFRYSSKEANLIGEASNQIKLELGCTYTLNLLASADSLAFWFVGKTIILPIYFDLDKSEIREDAKPILSDLLKTMNNYPNLAFEVGMHVDERYDNAYSTCLSCKRAESIRNYLVENGIDPKRVTAKGYNDSKPKMRNAKTEEQHQMNRRVEIRITSVDFGE